ncbi:protein kinase domain-containing protein [Nonomuraea soli]|uniref:tRNA A-37 threonylcarbamoyl transferase component Bud32/WD40 repeat protein n=1 Tax=Nonomuraea soli TaxID=1032476 RepID=A0A7W0CGS8_9ACTN|nr:protein kinase [Nonomuraea soli]MBA2890883.1 tRNA A-37 threonylcarbamoyl transferase component Bud32/WD40 repeat protein [Nonomuraea soli]
MSADPQRLGDYWLAGRLGSGGQGVVYEAYDAAANRVAVKVLHAYLPGDHQLRRRFLREVLAAQRVASFCTARVLDHDLDGERPYIVSEFVPGPSLRAALAPAGPLGGDGLRRLAVGMATALAAIHRAGVVHRDLKPENVLLGPDGPRVIDFGIARAAGLSMTSTGELTGTPMYMAPELFAGGRAEPAADVFAWGAMVYFAATGRDAFAAPTTVAVIHRLLTGDIDLGAIPRDLRALVAAALAKEPSERPAASELLYSLLAADNLEKGSTTADGRVSGGAAMLADGVRAAAEVRPPRELAGRPPLGVLAERAYAALPPHGREVARQVLLRLVDVRDGEETPRRATLAELPEPDETVLAALTEAELIERGHDTLAVGTPALLRAWPRLHEWVSADREALLRHRRLGEAARHWAAGGRHREDLLRGTALRESLAWASGAPAHLTMNQVEKRFLEDSRAQALRQGRVRKGVSTGVAALLVVSLAAGLFAWRQSALSDENAGLLAGQRAMATARQLALQADALRATDPVRAMLLSVAAYRISPVPEARSALFGSLARPERRVVRDPVAGNLGRALTADGRFLVSAGAGIVSVFEVETGRLTRRFGGVGDGPFRAAVAPDADTLALASEGRIRLWSLRSGTMLGEGRYLGPDLPSDNAPPPDEMTFSPGGGYIVMREGGVLSRFWRVATRSLVPLRFPGQIFVAPGDRYAIIDAGPAKALSGPAPKLVMPPRDGRILAFTGAGDVVVVAREQPSRLIRWDLRTGRQIGPALLTAAATEPAVSADGRFLVVSNGLAQSDSSVSAAPPVSLWRLSDGRELLRFTAPSLLQRGALLSRDNRLLTLLDDSGRVTSYDVAVHTAAAPGIPAGATERRFAGDALFARRGDDVVSWSVPAFTGGRAATSLNSGKYEDPWWGVSPDGKRVIKGITNNQGKPLRVVDTATGREVGRIPLGEFGSEPSHLAFSPDGKYIAASSGQSNDTYGVGVVTLWDARTFERVASFGGLSAGPMAFSGDGRFLVTADPAGVSVIDLTTRQAVPRSAGPGTLAKRWMTLSADGRIGVSPWGARGVTLWNTAGWQPTGQFLQVGGTVHTAQFSPDATLLAVAHDDRLTLFDVPSGRQLGAARTISAMRYGTADEGRPALSFSGGVLRVVAHDGTYRELGLDPERVAREVCERAGRGLAEAEWREHAGPDLPFVRICGSPNP